MIVLILTVGRRAVIAHLPSGLLIHRPHRGAGKNRIQPHLTEIPDCRLHHALKAQLIPDLHRALFRQIASHHFKALPVALRVRIRHKLHRLLRK